jgi:hypothetical protein
MLWFALVYSVHAFSEVLLVCCEGYFGLEKLEPKLAVCAIMLRPASANHFKLSKSSEQSLQLSLSHSLKRLFFKPAST